MVKSEDSAREGLELLDVGVGIFDADLRLVFANPAFRRLRRYPESLCQPGVSLESLLAFNAERGDFGPADPKDPGAQVRERLEEVRQALAKADERALEREMADGQILNIRYRGTASGGLLLTFEDRTAQRRAQRTLAASEERHALVTKATSDGIYDWDVTDDLLYVSENLTRILDFQLDPKSSKVWFEQIHPDDKAHYAEAVRRHFKGEVEAIDMEYRVRAKGGGYRWVHDRGVGGRNEAGRVTRLVGAVRDVTEARTAKAELDRSEARLVAALANISDGILLVDADDKVQLWNRRYEEIFSKAAGGADLSEVVVKGKPFLEMVRRGYELGMFKPHPDGIEGWIADRLTERAKAEAQAELELANGTWILRREQRMPDGGKVSVYSEITELKEREAELIRQQAVLELTLENMGHGISLVDRDLRTIALNRKFLELMEFPAARFKRGFTMAEAFRFNAERGEYGPGDPDAQVEERLKLAAEFRPHRFERTRPDGTVLEIVGNPIAGGGMVTTYTDVTERKQREAEITRAKEAAEAALADLRQAQERLVQAEKMASLGQLTAGIAHEIKNPLNFVNNFADLSQELLEELTDSLASSLDSLDTGAREDADDLLETLRENLEKIANHGRRADSIVKNMLAHSREGPSELQPTDVNALAQEAMNLAYHGARAENSSFNADMKSELAPDLGQIQCYPQDLMRVFLNLFANAIYAANKRKAAAGKDFLPEVTLTSRDLGDAVALEVRDNGIGIAPEDRDKLFTPFFTTKPAGEGTGLGLSLSYDIVVKQHGGNMTVDSEPDSFTAFTVTLPRRVPCGAEGVS